MSDTCSRARLNTRLRNAAGVALRARGIHYAGDCNTCMYSGGEEYCGHCRERGDKLSRFRALFDQETVLAMIRAMEAATVLLPCEQCTMQCVADPTNPFENDCAVLPLLEAFELFQETTDELIKSAIGDDVLDKAPATEKNPPLSKEVVE